MDRIDQVYESVYGLGNAIRRRILIFSAGHVRLRLYIGSLRVWNPNFISSLCIFRSLIIKFVNPHSTLGSQVDAYAFKMNTITFNCDPPISHTVPSLSLNTGAEPQHSSVTLRFALVSNAFQNTSRATKTLSFVDCHSTSVYFSRVLYSARQSCYADTVSITTSLSE
jgi:hypothetical protein